MDAPRTTIWRWSDAIALLIFCGLWGPGLDQLHTQSGTLTYKTHEVWDQAWWVAPQFAVLYWFVIWTASVQVVRHWRPRPDAPDDIEQWARPWSLLNRILVDGFWLVLSYCISCIPATDWGLEQDWTTTGALVALLAIGVVRMALRRSRAVLLFAIPLVVLGPLYEHILSGTGLYAYDHQEIGNVPIWLPALYLAGAPMAVSVAAFMDARGWRSRGRATGQAELAAAP
ncbi:MAG: hypothetical protein JWM98_1588 [Thermoleophilia bacterium]|nr:hypothetical protein [Thermoleophilia bacterium]